MEVTAEVSSIMKGFEEDGNTVVLIAIDSTCILPFFSVERIFA